MKTFKSLKSVIILSFFIGVALYLMGCSENVSYEEMTDDEYIKYVVEKGYSTTQEDDDNLMSNEGGDLDNGGPVPDNEGGGDNPIDSLIKWGRKIKSVSVTVTITSEGDTIKNASVVRTINGDYIIIGKVAGQIDTIIKPYTEVLKRNVTLKRVARTPRPRFNWRLYKVSMVDGETTLPQKGSDKVKMNKVEVIINGVLAYTFAGPDFTQNIFTTRYFGGAGIPEVRLGDQIKLVVYTTSTETDPDIVAWHWARNTFGFHREPFAMTQQSGGPGNWSRVYEKTFNIYNTPPKVHKLGRFNGYISASTRKSLWDDNPNEFASDLVGTPYRVLP